MKNPISQDEARSKLSGGFFKFFLITGLFQNGLPFAAIMSIVPWLFADQLPTYGGFAIGLFGFGGLTAFLGWVNLKEIAYSQPQTNPSNVAISYEKIIERNKVDYNVVGGLFLAGVLLPLSIYTFTDVDDNSAWPGAIGWSLAVFAPLAYLKVRHTINGGSISEFLKYGEIKDGISSSWQIALFWVWAIAACAIVAIAVYQAIA